VRRPARLIPLTEGRQKEVAIICEMVVVFFETAERASKIACDTGLLGNDKGFRHLNLQPKLTFAVIAIGKGQDAGHR